MTNRFVALAFVLASGGAPGFRCQDSALNFHTIHVPDLGVASALLEAAKKRSVNWGSDQVWRLHVPFFCSLMTNVFFLP